MQRGQEGADDGLRSKEFMDRINLLSVDKPESYYEGLLALLDEYFPDGVKPDVLKISHNVLKEIFSVAYKKLTNLMKEDNFADFERFAGMFLIPTQLTAQFAKHILTIGFPAQIVKVLKKYSYNVPITTVIKLLEPMLVLMDVERGIEQVLNEVHIDRHFFLVLIEYVAQHVTEDMGFEGETLPAKTFKEMNEVLSFLSKIYTSQKYEHHYITQPMLSLFIKRLALIGLLEDIKTKPESLPVEDIYNTCSHILNILSVSTCLDKPGPEIVNFLNSCATCKNLTIKLLALSRIFELSYYFDMNFIYTQEIHNGFMDEFENVIQVLNKENESKDTTSIRMARDKLYKLLKIYASCDGSYFALRMNLMEFNKAMLHIKETAKIEGELAILHYKIMSKIMNAVKDGLSGMYERGQPKKRDELRHDEYDASSIIDSDEDSEKYINGNELELYKCIRAINVAPEFSDQGDNYKHLEKRIISDSDYNSLDNEFSSKYDNINNIGYNSPTNNDTENQVDEVYDSRQFMNVIDQETSGTSQQREQLSTNLNRKHVLSDSNNPNPHLSSSFLASGVYQTQSQYKTGHPNATPIENRYSNKILKSSGSQPNSDVVNFNKATISNQISPTSYNSHKQSNNEATMSDTTSTTQVGETVSNLSENAPSDHQRKIENVIEKNKIGKSDKSNTDSVSERNNINEVIPKIQTSPLDFIKTHFSPELFEKVSTPKMSNPINDINGINGQEIQRAMDFYLPIFESVGFMLSLDNIDDLIDNLKNSDNDKIVSYQNLIISICSYLSSYYNTIGYAFKSLKGFCFCGLPKIKYPCPTCKLFRFFCNHTDITTGNIIRFVFSASRKDTDQYLETNLIQQAVDLIAAIYSMPAPLPRVFMNIVDGLVLIEPSKDIIIPHLLGSDDLMYLAGFNFFMTELLSAITLSVSNEITFSEKVAIKNKKTMRILKYVSVYIDPDIMPSKKGNISDSEDEESDNGDGDGNKKEKEKEKNTDDPWKNRFVPLVETSIAKYMLDSDMSRTLFDSTSENYTLLSLPSTGMKLLNMLLKIKQIAQHMIMMLGVVARVAVGIDSRGNNDIESDITAETLIKYMVKKEGNTIPGIVKNKNNEDQFIELSYLISQTNTRLLCELVSAASDNNFGALPLIVQNELIISTLRTGIRNPYIITNELENEFTKQSKHRNTKTVLNNLNTIGNDGLTVWMRIQDSKKINGQLRGYGEKQKLPRMMPSLCTQILRRIASIPSLRGEFMKNILNTEKRLNISAITGILALMYMSIRKNSSQKYTTLQLSECKRMAVDIINMIKEFLEEGPLSVTPYSLLKNELSIHASIVSSKSIILKPSGHDNQELVPDVFDVGYYLTTELCNVIVNKDFLSANDPGREMVGAVRGKGITAWTIFEVLRCWFYVYKTSEGKMGCSKKFLESLFSCLVKLVGPERQRFDAAATVTEIKFLMHNIQLFMNTFYAYAVEFERKLTERFESIEELEKFINRDMKGILLEFLSLIELLVQRPEFNKSMAKSWNTKGFLLMLDRMCSQIMLFENVLEDVDSKSDKASSLIQTMHDHNNSDNVENENIQIKTITGDDNGNSNSNNDDNNNNNNNNNKIIITIVNDNDNNNNSGSDEANNSNSRNNSNISSDHNSEVHKSIHSEDNIGNNNNSNSNNDSNNNDNSQEDQADSDQQSPMDNDANEFTRLIGELIGIFDNIKGKIVSILRLVLILSTNIKVRENTINFVIKSFINNSFKKFNNNQKTCLIKLLAGFSKSYLKSTTNAITNDVKITVDEYYSRTADIVVYLLNTDIDKNLPIVQTALHMLVRLTKYSKSNQVFFRATNIIADAIKEKNITNKKVMSYLSDLQSKFKSG